LKLQRSDAAIAAVISVIFFVSAAYNVGFTHIPSTSWSVIQGNVILTLAEPANVSKLYVYAVSDKDITASFSTYIDGVWRDKAWMNNNTWYKWITITFNETTDRIRAHFYFGSGEILEIAAVDTVGNQVYFVKAESTDVGSTSISNLIDEQSLFENPPTYRGESLFDEALFIRASQQILNGQEPTAEETHPPLGKLILAASIETLGFNPFAWRIPGVIFATLMIPIVYALSYALFRTRAAATIAAALLALDFMHFTMGRIGTVDTFLVFFMLISTLLFYLNYEKMAHGGPPDYKLLSAALLAFSLAFSIKWIAIFGFIGEALLFLAVGVYGRRYDGNLWARLRSLAKPIAIIACLTPVIGGVVYFSTYIPYMSAGHSLSDVWANQFSMLGYHERMALYTHPSATQWYEWPLTMSPLLFTADTLTGPLRSGIVDMGNPVIWWVGLVAIILSVLDGIKLKWPHLFLGVLYIVQLLPYALISRYLFIYHYYAEVPIITIAIAGLFHETWYKKGQRAYVIALIVAASIAFVVFYPVISGLLVPRWYTKILSTLWWRFY
jgi:dolichyl-phosphate-mannose-protein mannosyltransferase